MNDVVAEKDPTADRLDRKAAFLKFKVEAAAGRAELRLKRIRRPFDKGWAKHAKKKTKLRTRNLVPVALSEIRQHAKGGCRHCASQGVLRCAPADTRRISASFGKPGIRKLGAKALRAEGYIPCSCSLSAFTQVNAVRLYREPAGGKLFWTHRLP